MQLFELQPENITLNLLIRRPGAELRVSHVLRPPRLDDWLAYDRALSVAIEDGAEGFRVLSEPVAAACLLWDSIVLSVAGYFQSGIALEGEAWKHVIPPAHKTRAVASLLNVSLATVAAPLYTLEATEETVVLEARREAKFPQLAHRFRRPTQAQHIEVERLKADSYIVRGRKSGRDRTVYPSRLKRLCELYDALILGTEGYAVSGRPTVDAEVRMLMDAQHKKVSVLALFGSEEVDVEESASENGGDAA